MGPLGDSRAAGPLVSVVTPSYNQGRFLEQTIQSVLVQEYPAVEYILVDGGSTDDSRAIIERYAEHFSWWVSEPDHGQSDAIRKGFAHATGDILCWLNSDDLFAPGAISRAVQALEADPGLGFVYGNAISIDQYGRPMNDMKFTQLGMDDLAAFEIICQPAVFMHRAAYEGAGGVDPGYHLLMDHHLWLRIAARWPIRYVDCTLAFARRHGEAKNVTQAESFGREARRIARWLLSDSTIRSTSRVQMDRTQAGALRFGARYLLDKSDYRGAFRGYWAALRTHPRTALREWRRILFAFLGLLGMGKLGGLYYSMKYRRGSASLPGLENVSSLYPPLQE